MCVFLIKMDLYAVVDKSKKASYKAEDDYSTGRNVSKTSSKDDTGFPVCLLIGFITLFIAVVAMVIAIIVAFVMIASIQSDKDALMHTAFDMQNKTSVLARILRMNEILDEFHENFDYLQLSLQNNLSHLNILIFNLSSLANELPLELDSVQNDIITLQINITTSIYKHKSTIMSTTNKLERQVQDNVSSYQSGIGQLLNNFEQKFIADVQTLHAFDSCDSITALEITFPSGMYLLRSPPNVRVYCNMELVCDQIKGGWRRITRFNASDRNHNECPGNLERVSEIGRSNNLPSCRRSDQSAGCSEVIYANNNISYSRVCAKINAYLVNTPDGFRSYQNSRPNGINTDDNYVDGVSLTYGTDPRNHIWTFAVDITGDCSSCGVNIPSFLVNTNHYSCEKCAGTNRCQVLWDNEQCNNGHHWIYRSLSKSVNEDIGMRVCRDQDRGDEDIKIFVIEVYVQ